MKVLPLKSDESSFRIYKIILYTLKTIGLAPFSLEEINYSSRNFRKFYHSYGIYFTFSKLGTAYNISLSIFIFVMGAFAIPDLSSMSYPNKSSITQAIDIMNGSLRSVTTCIIILYEAFKQEKKITALNRLSKVYHQLCDIERNRTIRKKSSIFFAMQMILDAVIWLTLWGSQGIWVKTFFHWFIFNIPIFVIHWFVVEYSILLRTVAKELKNLNRNLMNFEEFPNHLVRTRIFDECNSRPSLISPICGSQLATLKSLHQIRTTLLEVSQDIADCFSFPILFVVGCFSLALVYNIYFLITPIVVTSSNIPLAANVNAIAWILSCIYSLILLSLNVTKTVNEANQTGLIVHKLLTKTRGQEIQKELERFSLQLIHENLSFTAFGFFELDFTLIQSIFGVTATYLVIVVQFMQSAAHTSKDTRL